MIVIGGVQWLFAAGNPTRIGKAKETIVAAVLGLLLAFVSVGMLRIINPDLVNCSPPFLRKAKLRGSGTTTATGITMSGIKTGGGYKTRFWLMAVCNIIIPNSPSIKPPTRIVQIPLQSCEPVHECSSFGGGGELTGAGNIGYTANFQIPNRTDCPLPFGFFVKVETEDQRGNIRQHLLGEDPLTNDLCDVIDSDNYSNSDLLLSGKCYQRRIPAPHLSYPSKISCNFNASLINISAIQCST